MKSAISINGIHAVLGGKTVLGGVSCDIAEGSVVAVIGPSGSGKTTLLRTLNGLCPLDAGSITIEDVVILPHTTINLRAFREHVGMVFQQFNLWPHMTVLENLIEAPMLVKKVPREVAVLSAISHLKQVGLEEKQDAYPLALSGGQQQRTGIARALMMEPRILLLDEVTSALDPQLAWDVLQVIRSLAKERSQTMVIVTHELSLARDIADQVLFMDEGRIIERGPPQELFGSPTDERLKSFLDRFMHH